MTTLTHQSASRNELRTETLRILGDLVAFPTVTSASNLALVAYITELLDRVGAECTLTYDADRRKANIFATIGPGVDGGVVLSGHTDVVPASEGSWTSPPFTAVERDGRVHGRGTTDMKGFIACALALAPRFARSGLAAPIHLALTYDEEVGCLGAPVLIDELSRAGPRPKAAIVGEPTTMQVITAHKGCYEFTTSIVGLGGHGAVPDKAVNAVEHAARYIARLGAVGEELTRDVDADSPYDPPWTTISVGTIRGGAARNIAAAECTFEWEMRPVRRGDAEHVIAQMDAFSAELTGHMRQRHPAAEVVTTTVGAVEGLEVQSGSAAVALASELLDAPEFGVVSFSTEAGLYQLAGIPAIVCGPGSIDAAHRPDEHVSLAQLDACLDMMERLADHLSRKDAAP